MRPSYSQRTEDVMESYIMKLIEVAKRPGMISFATGLPDKRLFDVKGLREAADYVLDSDEGTDSLQYGVTFGLESLRKKISDRCNNVLGLSTKPENIVMTNGSQECFDMLGKMFLERGSGMVVENPGYLGALQSFSVYGPEFHGVDLHKGGVDIAQFKDAVKKRPKLFYSIPNHQNPSGVSYSDDVRRQVAEIISDSETLVIEDDAYGELAYGKRAGVTISSLTDNSVFTGSFSKVISPGMRVGWMVVQDWMVPMVSTFVEAGCLHAGSFVQRVLDRFLATHDYDAYLKPIRAEYKRKKDLFVDLMEDELPDFMGWNDPDGGMFVWLRSPEGTDAMKIYQSALEHGLVVMPGKPFHVRGGENTIRLNFATADDENIKAGMHILAEACRSL